MISARILSQLKSVPKFAYYFRYPLHEHDFHEVRRDGRLVGRFASKGLYGKLDKRGHVDRSGGLNGQVATVFIPTGGKTGRTSGAPARRPSSPGSDTCTEAAPKKRGEADPTPPRLQMMPEDA